MKAGESASRGPKLLPFRAWPEAQDIRGLSVACARDLQMTHDGRPTAGFTDLVKGAAVIADPEKRRAKLKEFTALAEGQRPGELMARVAKIRASIDLQSFPPGPWEWVGKVFK